MKRKVIKQGHDTLTISLPKIWCKKLNVKGGIEVDVTENGDELVVNAKERKEEKKEVTIEIPEMESKTIKFLIRNLYIDGYDNVTINFKKNTAIDFSSKVESTVLNIIAYEVRRLMGFEIVNTGSNFCHLQNLSRESIEEFDISLRRSFGIVNEWWKEIKKATMSGYNKLPQFGQDMHDQITKLISYNLRILNKIGYKDKRMTLRMFQILYKIDDIIDLIKECLKETGDKMPFKSKLVLEITDETSNLFESASKLFYKFDFQAFSRSCTKKCELIDKIIDASSKSSKIERRYLTYLENILEELRKLNIARMSLEY